MPALPPVPNVLKVEIQGNTSEATPLVWANILHVLYTGTAPTNTVCNTIASAIFTAWGAHMAAECPAPTVLTATVVTDLTTASSGAGEATGSTAGTRGDDEIPANVAYLVTYPVSTRYRGGHPRSYLIVGGNADFLDAAHWSTAFTAEVLTHWQAFLNAWIGSSFSGTTISELVAVSYISKEINPTPPYRRTTPVVYPLSVSGAIGNQQMASQRRRIGRHRR